MSYFISAGQSLKHLVIGYGRGGDLKSKPKLLKWRSSKFIIITTVVLGIYVDIFLYGSTVVVLPFILESQAGVAPDQIGKWTGLSMLAYSVASLASSPIAGFLADIAHNRREPLLLGLVFLLTGCVCLWVADNTTVLLVGRCLQGISAGFVWSIGLALIADTVGYAEVGEVLAYADIALCFGLASAPPISGTILRYYDKDAVYSLVMSLIVVDVLMRLFLIERSVADKFELPSQEVVQLNSPVMETVSRETVSKETVNSEPDETSNETSRVARYWKYAKVLLNSWRILGALIGTWAVAHILISIDVVVPVFCEKRYGWGPLKVGVLLFCFYGPSLLCIFTGRLADRHGGRWLAMGGFLGCVPPFIGLSAVEMFSDEDAPLVMWLLVGCAGISLSFANTPVMAEIVYALMDKQERYPALRQNSGGYGLAYGLFMTVFSLGSATASAGSPPFLNFKHGWSAAMYSLAGCSLLAVLPVALLTGQKRPAGRWGMRKKPSEPLVTEETVESRIEDADALGNT
ncbi:major facilitator superfamily domain-containing protein [Dactylonectria estremocensis]|uniref:Major facilitator superfamily domain-containing protein n=1 Tax=Dactylonectria estremocensis TaxID=1079267 RepID=A0A9P9F1R1_9HYPO|nr:major facilitator superfamily domain-containing protein [Dactylonectria estremocensis]